MSRRTRSLPSLIAALVATVIGTATAAGATPLPAVTPASAPVSAAAPIPTPAPRFARAPVTDVPYAVVSTDDPIRFPGDAGSHPRFRTEWWYVTGWLQTSDGSPLGFQITFFRTKPRVDEANPSAFVAHQIMIAHCALSDPKRGRLWQDQRIRRAGLGLAGAREGATDTWIDRWSLKRTADLYSAKIDAEDFALQLELAVTSPPMVNGRGGVSQKGPAPASASHYYSEPHLKVAGSVIRAGVQDPVSGEAWLDHEWSSEYLDPSAVGWDWTGINFDNGDALMAFRIRGADGSTHWSGGSLLHHGTVQVLAPDELHFRSDRHWTSPRTGIDYPVHWVIDIGDREVELQPLMDDQENDTRLSTGAIYWEGAVRALEGHAAVGKGYLELTGYGNSLKLP